MKILEEIISHQFCYAKLMTFLLETKNDGNSNKMMWNIEID